MMMMMMMTTSSKWFLLFEYWVLFSVILFHLEPKIAGSNSISCIKEEREALLEFKQSLVDEFGFLSSWGSEDKKKNCCNWRGIRCSNQSGHVKVLDLHHPGKVIVIHLQNGPRPMRRRNMTLRGTINPALLKLHDLRHLDLSLNDFSGSSFPEFIGSLRKLRYLNLSDVGFFGPIPPQLGNLSRLQVFDLGLNDLIRGETLEWVSHLSFLRYLDLTGCDLSKSTNWLQEIDKLPSLKALYLEQCDLQPIIPWSFWHLNSSTSFEILDLSYNNLNSSIYPWLFNVSSNVVELHLDSNQLEGSIPDALGNIISLKSLSLSDNKFDGEIPEFFQDMFKLESLSLRGNSLKGVISENFFSNFSNLEVLDLSDNSLVLEFSHDWIPPFQLDVVILSSCKMGPHFPKWLQTQELLFVLDISNNEISEPIPDWFWDSSHKLFELNISHNQMKGSLPNYLSSMFIHNSPGLDISSNHFEGPIPMLPPNAFYINLSQNMFSGTISFLCSFNGQNLVYLDLSSNLLFGRLPDCWLQFNNLRILNLASNNFSGNIPNSLGHLDKMLTLSLHHNSFSGELPLFLKNCTNLRVMILEKNSLTGNIPAWIGESLPYLLVLSLRSNRFYGNMPFQLCHLVDIRILDLSLNNLSGSIPKCFNNFTSMVTQESSNFSAINFGYTAGVITMLPLHIFSDNVLLTWKGSEYEYKSTLGLVKSLDLSSNKLGGAIPEEIMDLVGLIALNFSRNNLTAQISPKIGQFLSLDFLDLSRNQLYGGIPSSLSQLSRLSVMDLSYNNLSGKIPVGTQLQSFNASMYAGNPKLCGLPTPNKCPDEELAHAPSTSEGKDDANTPEDVDQFITLGFYISMVLGFFVGFWGVCGTLLLNNPWKLAFNNFLSGINDWLYVTAAINIAKLRQRLRN